MHSPVCLRARPWSNRRVADGAPQAATLRPRAASSVMNSRLFKRLNSVCLRGSRTAPHSTQNSVSRSGVSVTYFAVRPENRGMSGSHQPPHSASTRNCLDRTCHMNGAVHGAGLSFLALLRNPSGYDHSQCKVSNPATSASQSRSRFVHLTAPSPIIFTDKVFSASYPRLLWSNTVDYAAGMALTGLLRKEITEEGTRSWTEASIKLRSHGPSTVMKTRFPSSGLDHAS
jgi:hypothetical protein